MKTKKLVVAAVLAVLGTSAQAQIVSSRSNQVVVTETPVVKEKKPKKPRTFKWNLRAGYSFDSMIGGHDLSGCSGFDASFGISKPFGNNGLFWGVEAGAMTYGACIKDDDASSCLGVDILPRIGIKIPLANEMALSIYGGPYVGYDIDGVYSQTSTTSWDSGYYTDGQGNQYSWSKRNGQVLKIRDFIDVGINLGVELFVSKNLFFDIHVKKGFIRSGYSHVYDSYHDSGNSNRDHDIDDYKDISSLKIVLGIGLQF